MFFSAAINPCYFNGFLTYIPLFSAADFATFLCASRLIVTPASYGYAIWYFTRSGTGSFRRDSAGSYRPTQASGFHGWERPSDWQIPSLHAPPGAAAFYVPAHRGCLSSVSSVAFGAPRGPITTHSPKPGAVSLTTCGFLISLGRNRTGGTPIISGLLYHLSYKGILPGYSRLRARAVRRPMGRDRFVILPAIAYYHSSFAPKCNFLKNI